MKTIVDGKVVFTDDPPNTLDDYLKPDKGTILIGVIAVAMYIALFLPWGNHV